MSLLETEDKIGKSESIINEILKFVFKDRYTYVRNTF
jgi:hypothetical protein